MQLFAQREEIGCTVLRSREPASAVLLVSVWFPAAVLPLACPSTRGAAAGDTPSAAAVRDEGRGGEPGTEEGAQSRECLRSNPAMAGEIRGRWGRCRGLGGARGCCSKG